MITKNCTRFGETGARRGRLVSIPRANEGRTLLALKMNSLMVMLPGRTSGFNSSSGTLSGKGKEASNSCRAFKRSSGSLAVLKTEQDPEVGSIGPGESKIIWGVEVPVLAPALPVALVHKSESILPRGNGTTDVIVARRLFKRFSPRRSNSQSSGSLLQVREQPILEFFLLCGKGSNRLL